MDVTGHWDASVDGESVADRFARLAVELHATDGVEETVGAVVEFALQALGCSHAGVELITRSGPEVPAATDPLVAEIFRHVMATGNGPLTEPMRTPRDGAGA